MPSRQLSLIPGDFIDYTDPSVADGLLTDIYPLIWLTIIEPWRRVQLRRAEDEEFRDQAEDEIAWWLHGRIKRTAAELCEQYPHFGCRAATLKSRQFYLDVGGNAVIVFKKIRQNKKKRRLERSNVKTKGNLDFWQQRKDQGCADAPRYIAGYEITKEMTEVIIRICYPRSRGRFFQWSYPVVDQAEAVKALLSAKRVDPPTEGEEKKGFIVRHRRMDSREHGTK